MPELPVGTVLIRERISVSGEKQGADREVCLKTAISLNKASPVRGFSVNALFGVPRQPRAGAFF